MKRFNHEATKGTKMFLAAKDTSLGRALRQKVMSDGKHKRYLDAERMFVLFAASW
jgi:hypothetical protein